MPVNGMRSLKTVTETKNN